MIRIRAESYPCRDSPMCNHMLLHVLHLLRAFLCSCPSLCTLLRMDKLQTLLGRILLHWPRSPDRVRIHMRRLTA